MMHLTHEPGWYEESPQSRPTTGPGKADPSICSPSELSIEEQEEQELLALWEEAPLLAYEEMIVRSRSWGEEKRDTVSSVGLPLHRKVQRSVASESAPVTDPKGYVQMKVARHEADRIKQKQLLREMLLCVPSQRNTPVQVLSVDAEKIAELNQDPDADTETEVLQAIRQQQFMGEVAAALSPPAFETVLLRIQGYQYPEIAKLRGCTPAAARVRYNNALIKLRKVLSEEWAAGF